MCQLASVIFFVDNKKEIDNKTIRQNKKAKLFVDECHENVVVFILVVFGVECDAIHLMFLVWPCKKSN